MTVAELIECLRAHPPSLRVVVDGYEDGYDDLANDRIIVTGICLDTGREFWQGKHGELPYGSESAAGNVEIVEALVLRRSSGVTATQETQ